jgi:histidyl-tRNA synthetase
MMRTSIPADELFTKARTIGQYYGFTPLTELTAKKRGELKQKGYPEALGGLALDQNAETIASFLKQCQGTTCAPTPRQPLFLWHTNIAPGRPAQKRSTVQFHALGADRALADALIIRAMTALVRDLFHEEPVVRINSMGDKETRARYVRELGNFFKKRAGILPEDCTTCAKRDMMEAAELVIAREMGDGIPAPTEHLSDASRKRFEDLLEYLEMTETPYELARTLLSRGNIWNDTCFEIMIGDKRIAWGSRYNDLAKHFFPGAPFTATGAVLQIIGEGVATVKTKVPKHRFSFVHIGDEAKRISIGLAEEFRKARVPMTQNIGTESLSEQLFLAERRESPYVLIMGRKEAIEKSVILRDQETKRETVLPLHDLINRLKAFA